MLLKQLSGEDGNSDASNNFNMAADSTMKSGNSRSPPIKCEATSTCAMNESNSNVPSSLPVIPKREIKIEMSGLKMHKSLKDETPLFHIDMDSKQLKEVVK